MMALHAAIPIYAAVTISRKGDESASLQVIAIDLSNKGCPL